LGEEGEAWDVFRVCQGEFLTDDDLSGYGGFVITGNYCDVFGASNVTELLSELTPFQCEDAINSLTYEAELCFRDPVYSCVGVNSLLHHQLRKLLA
ncbi:hypothetical protein Taro_014510, partial [Colocasia esculenta]|nr:hypothetical protein [Colocasia esculenta]